MVRCEARMKPWQIVPAGALRWRSHGRAVEE